MMKRALTVCVLVGFLLAVGVSAFAEGQSERTFVRIATAGSGGNYYRLGAAIASVWNDEIEDLTASTQSTDGSPHNAELMAAGDVEVAFMGGEIAYQAYRNLTRFEDQPDGKYEDLRYMAFMYPNPQMFLVADWATDEIEDETDFPGMRVSKGLIGSQGEAVFYASMEAIGVDIDDVTMEDTVHGSAIDQFRDRQIDVVYWPDAVGSPSHMEILETGNATAYDIHPDIIEYMTTGDWATNITYTLPADTYPNQPEDIDTFASPIVLLIHRDVSEELAYELAKALFNNQDNLESIAGMTATFMNKENAGRAQVVPVHPGVERYYQEIGAMD